MATNASLESDSLLPPRKRLLAGFKKQNSKIGNESPSPPFASSSSITTSNGSSASTDVQTHLGHLLTSQLNDQTRSPEELAQASKATAALAVKVAKAARATANEKAIIASKAVAAAKSALELFASFPVEAVACKERSRLSRAINNSPRVLTDCSGHRNKKQKTVTSTMYDGNDVAGVVDSDNRTRVNGKLLLCDNALKEKTGEESSSLGKRRGRVKLKKLPLSMCASKDQENGITLAENNVSVSKPEGSNVGVGQVIEGPSWKCQDLKSPECVKQNKVVRS
ncbi:hypothetical protein ARALYDRAFT_480644 [Arabidopsis lyrata subsp. lyrata]|uniref:Uncharacterized protein n=1 Tax=Arabidopsis lyrata subsp. lyrata TaxID=81972 RepID=D7L9F8_ARALL|nr:hypothetical protein ARALYDRAFT_480644 [Arabidopsis lyrata subsp. lyrata]